MTTALKGLIWVGGKSVAGIGSGRWVAAQLPHRRVYIEPFAGMLGVLLQRRPSRREMVSDLDGRVVNWWRQVRDRRADLERLLDATPGWSEAMFVEAVEAEDDPVVQADPLMAAYWFTLRMSWTFGGKVEAGPRDVRRSYTDDPAGTFMSVPLRALQNRIKRVELEHRDAQWMLERYGHLEEAVIYCDPPYETASRVHRHIIGDKAAMSAALAACKGFVAVSGYAGEWDELGWHRSVKPVKNTLNAGSYTEDRLEVLWTNQPPMGQEQLWRT